MQNSSVVFSWKNVKSFKPIGITKIRKDSRLSTEVLFRGFKGYVFVVISFVLLMETVH